MSIPPTKTEASQIAARMRAAQWAKDHPDKYRERQARWRKENGAAYRLKNAKRIAGNNAKSRAKRAQADPDYYKRQHAKRYQEPEYAEKCRRRAKKCRQQSPSRSYAMVTAWKKANPERAKSIAHAGWINRRARKLAAGKITTQDVKAIRDRRACAHCGNVHPKMEIDHIIALSKGGTNHISNLQLLCRPCNRSKSAKDHVAWAQERSQPATL